MADSMSVPYKGRLLKITVRGDGTATVDIDGRTFSCTHHTGGVHGASQGAHASMHGSGHNNEPVGLPMWMCDEAYFGSFDLIDLAKHFADFGYMFDDPNRIVCDEHGNVVKPAKKSTAKKTAAKKSAAKKSAAKKTVARARS